MKHVRFGGTALLVALISGCAAFQQQPVEHKHVLVKQWFLWADGQESIWPIPPRACQYSNGTVAYMGDARPCPKTSAI